METIKKVGFGYVNVDEQIGKDINMNTVFGLNENVYAKSIIFNKNAGSGGSPTNAFDVTFDISGATQRLRLFEVRKVFGKDGEIADQNDPEYVKNYNANINQTLGTIIHVIKAFGVTEENIQKALTTELPDFETWCNKMLSLLPANYSTHALDLFMEFQWSPTAGYSRKLLQVPNNMKGGYFLAPHREAVGKWIPQRAWTEAVEGGNIIPKTGLRYIDNANNVHVFKRGEAYMKSAKAIQEKDGAKELSDTENRVIAPKNTNNDTW